MAFAPGARLDEWVIDDILGGGRDGVVYRGHEASNPRNIVALKVYAIANPRLRREFEVIHSLDHPNIVAVHHARFDGAYPYLVLDHIDGPTLARWMSEGAMEPKLAETVFRDALSAIAYLHERGLYHRDVKPQNFLFDRVHGRLVLVDFGHVHGRDAPVITSPDIVFASLAYAPPECGSDAENDAARDLYALGVILYEMLTGRHAFTFDRASPPHEQLLGLREQQQRGPLDPGPPSPGRLRELVRSTTAPNPDDRLKSANAVQELLDLDPDAATPARPPQRIATPRMNTQTRAPRREHPWRQAFQRWWDR